MTIYWKWKGINYKDVTEAKLGMEVGVLTKGKATCILPKKTKLYLFSC